MEKSANSNDLTPFIISVSIHMLFLSLLASISYLHYSDLKKKPFLDTTKDVDIESISVSGDNDDLQAGSDRDALRRGAGPYGLNDEAGRELWATARSGISITPDNFLEYAKTRNLRKGLNPKAKEDIYRKYPFLTGSTQFQSGIDHKLKSDFQECYEDVCRIIEFDNKGRASIDDDPDIFSAAVLEFLDGKREVRTWRTLWMARKPAALKDKIKLVRLLRRLHNYGIEGDNAGYEHLRKSIGSLINTIPDDLKFPAIPRG
jgi:hypothetical protein